MNQQWSNSTTSYNARMKIAQEGCFTWVECTSECCKKWDWRVCKVSGCVVRRKSSVSPGGNVAAAWVRVVRAREGSNWRLGFWNYERNWENRVRDLREKMGARVFARWECEGSGARREWKLRWGVGPVEKHVKKGQQRWRSGTAWREVTSR